MKKSADPNLYTLPRRDRDPIGVIFPSIGIVIWVGAASFLGGHASSCTRLRLSRFARPASLRASLLTLRPDRMGDQVRSSRALRVGNSSHLRARIYDRRARERSRYLPCRLDGGTACWSLTATHRPSRLRALGHTARSSGDRLVRSRSRRLRGSLARPAVGTNQVPARRKLSART